MMSRKPAIPKEIKEQVQEVVTQFNEANKTRYKMMFRGKYGYLSKNAGFLYKEDTKLGRLTWTGDMAKWKFAVFRYSREFYDPDEFMFPGAEELDGTIEGALEAGKQLYP